MRIKRLISILAVLCLLCSSLPAFEASAVSEAPSGGMFDVQFGKGMVLDCQRTVTANTDESGGESSGYTITANGFDLPYSAVTNNPEDLETDYLKLEYVGATSEMSDETKTALDDLIQNAEDTAPVFKLVRYTRDGTKAGDFSNVGYLSYCGEGLCLLFTVRGGTATNSYGYFLQAKIQYGEGLQSEYSGETDETLTESLGDMEVFPTLKQITVATTSGEAVTLYVNEGDTVDSVKKQLLAKEGTSSDIALSSGGICGENKGAIRNCVNQGAVTSAGGGSSGYVGCGGICGYNVGGSVENCYNTGTVTGTNGSEYSGGVCGVNFSGTVANCFNTGAVTGQGRLAGVCADASGGTVTNCYYDSEKCAAGDSNSGVAGKPTAEFASGEVAKLLQGDDPNSPWGQAIGTDGLPVLLPTLPEAEQEQKKTIYTVTFMVDAAECAKAYANPGGTVELPDSPTKEGYDFAKWAGAEGAEFTSSTPVNADMTVSAVWSVKADATVTLPDGAGTVTGSDDGSVTVTDSHGTATTITPPAGGDKVTVNTETGEITVPGGSVVKTGEDGAEITLPQGGNVKPGGAVTVPEGGTVTIEDDQGTKTIITPPSGGEVIPSEDGGVHVDKGTTVQTGDGPVITLPEIGDGGTVLPSGTVSGSPIQVGDTIIDINTTDPTQGDITTDKDGNVTLPGGTTANVDRDGDGTPEATVTIPAGDGTSPADPGVVKPNGEMELPGGGSVTISDGNGATTKITVPENGGTVKPGGEVVYTVTFDTQDGSPATSQTVTAGDKAVKPSDPTRSGYTFEGWYTEAACTTEWDFNNAVTGNMTLYALWTKKPNPVTPGPDNPPVWENPFTDIKENDWYYAAVEFANENGLFYGTSDATFGPNDDMSRGMMAAVLYRLAKEPGTAAEDLFSDVADGKYYTEAVAWAAENNIVSGYDNGKYGPEDSITREQLATILWRYAGSPESTGSLDKFTDRGKTSYWAVSALQWAAEQKIVSGKGNGILDPRGKATRAEVAAMLMRYCETEQ